LESVSGEISIQHSKLELARKRAERSARLVKEGFLSPASEQDQEDQALDQHARLQTLERGRLSLGRERELLLAEQRQISTQLSSDIAALERDNSALTQESIENAARRQSVVLANQAGVVTAVNASEGQSVSAGQILLAISPQGAQLEAVLFAPSRAAGFVSLGQRVMLRHAAYPYQKFGLYRGTVSAISESVIASTELTPAQQALFGRLSSEALYRITVALDAQQVSTYGQLQPLKAGMALEADVVQDRRRIIEWLFEPVFAFQRRTS
jgi:membrane fusion protein